MDSELSEEFMVKVWIHQGSVLSPFLFALVVDVVTEFLREGVIGEFLYADDLVLMSETMEGLRSWNVRRLLRAKVCKLTWGKPR